MFLYLGCHDDKRLAKGIAQVCASRIVFNLEHIRDKNLKIQLYKALEYWTFIHQMLSQQPDTLLRNHLVDVTQEATRWLQMVYHLAERIDKFRSNRIIQRDRQSLPVDIKIGRGSTRIERIKILKTEKYPCDPQKSASC